MRTNPTTTYTTVFLNNSTIKCAWREKEKEIYS